MSDHIKRYRGDTYPIAIVVSTRAGAVDITGWSLTLSVAPDPAPATAAYTFQAAGTIDSAAAGTAHFDFTAEQVDLVGEYHYDIQITDAAGKKRTIKKGRMTFMQDINKG